MTALIFAGKIGPISFAAALALKQRDQLYRYLDEPQSSANPNIAGYKNQAPSPCC